MEHYCHDPLPGQGYIRLATIHPGKFEDDIVVSFHTSTFPNNTLPYEALSYVWGSDKSHTPIYISEDNTAIANGSRDVSQMGFKQLWVTQNLDVALRHLRYDEAPRVMWTDALCINQTNEVEKGPQVAMMGEIFRLACRVIAWLGPDENDSNRALHLMNYFGSQVEVDFVKQEMRPVAGCTNRSIGDCNIGLPLQDRDVSSIYHLLCRQWFERLWIRQEIYLAGPEAVIMCGLNQVKWSSFRRGLACTYLKHTPNLTEQFNTRMNVLHGFIFQENFNKLMDLDHKYNNTQCLDPRDRLYAVLAMLKDDEKALIPSPDYTQPYDKLYATVVRNWIGSNNSLNILCQCRPNDGTCPSWVPDWSKPDTRSIVFAPYIYMSPFTSWHEFPHPDVLRVMGVSKCVVSEYHQLPQLSNHRNILLEQIRTLLLKVDLEEKHATKDYTRLLAHDNFPYSFDPPIFNFPDFEVAEQCVEFIMSDRDINGASNKK
ncbi:Heterokaryon incompatibility protein 6, OR allele [Daldinia childiae]|uniref:Heterokaryon incompatibility protein 6, OR allele n=1 Tax=Daldinia childiae TaxID=326645 RepID=UPI0014474199|nr:Heterokaryon incompatibility protein 6, OR allele [Daldinia childiae]KAF3059753.1 Heterokaryon incompatibility protein 6, OR allele [Daldinia childiae]